MTGGGFMPDGSTILFSRLTASTTNDLAVAHLDRPDAIVALTNEPGQELLPTPSPDGRWLAFVTDRTGRPEVVIARLFSDGTTFRLGQRLPVSAGGGIDPTWRKDGREIVYLAPDATLMPVAVTVDGEAVTLGKPTPRLQSAGRRRRVGVELGCHRRTCRNSSCVEAPRANAQRFRLLTDWMAGK